MNLSEILDWVARYPGHAFVAGCFALFGLAIVCDFLTKFVRSLTGKYPAPSPVVQCDCDKGPCRCCRENGCMDGCRCDEGDE
jgi:hypothetical protein